MERRPVAGYWLQASGFGLLANFNCEFRISDFGLFFLLALGLTELAEIRSPVRYRFISIRNH